MRTSKHSVYHPATVMITAVCLWLLIVAVNELWLSLTICALSLLCAASWKARLGIVVLVLPVFLSMVVVYAPYGQHRIAPLITSDGLWTSIVLSARFLALMSCIIACVSRMHVVDIAKWVQTSPAGHKVAYIVGSSLQFLPQGAEAVQAVQDAHFLEGTRSRTRAIMPVISRLLTQGVRRGHALVATGFDQPGRRTILRAVPDSHVQKIYRWCLPVLCIVFIVWW